MVMRGRGAVLLVAAGVLVAGCTGAAAPVETTGVVTSSASATPTPSPTATPTVDVSAPPERPAAMAEPSAEGAAAAASYFMALFAYTKSTNDLREWDAMASPDCDFCAGVRSEVASRADRGLRNAGTVDVISAEGSEVDPGRWYSARLHVAIGASVDLDSDGATVESHPPEEHDIDVVMTWDGDSWIVDEVGPATTPTS